MSNKKIRKKDCFIDLVGYNKSLKMCVNQGKAAVCYPPHGLNTLIVGETGVGKSLFAEKNIFILVQKPFCNAVCAVLRLEHEHCRKYPASSTAHLVAGRNNEGIMN